MALITFARLEELKKTSTVIDLADEKQVLTFLELESEKAKKKILEQRNVYVQGQRPPGHIYNEMIGSAYRLIENVKKLGYTHLGFQSNRWNVYRLVPDDTNPYIEASDIHSSFPIFIYRSLDGSYRIQTELNDTIFQRLESDYMYSSSQDTRRIELTPEQIFKIQECILFYEKYVKKSQEFLSSEAWLSLMKDE